MITTNIAYPCSIHIRETGKFKPSLSSENNLMCCDISLICSDAELVNWRLLLWKDGAGIIRNLAVFINEVLISQGKKNQEYSNIVESLLGFFCMRKLRQDRRIIKGTHFWYANMTLKCRLINQCSQDRSLKKNIANFCISYQSLGS